MKNNALLVFNPKSGANERTLKEVLEHILLQQKGFDLSDFEVSGDDVAIRLKDAISLIQPSLVIIAGGDGTIKLTAECLSVKVPMAILPLGSANGLAKCLGICIFEDGLEALRKLDTIQVDAIQINDEICLHLADFGFNASMIRNFEQRDVRGILGYFKSSITEAFSTESSRFRLEMPDETVELEAKMLVIANGREYGTGAIINSEGKLDDGKFEIIAVEVTSPDEFISLAKSMITGEVLDQSAVRTWSMNTCKIFNLDQAKFQIDGEVRGKPSSIEVKIKKEAFEFVRKS